MDDIDRAQDREQSDRDMAIKAARCFPVRDLEHELCGGCDYRTKSSYGASCEAWRDCL